MRRPVFSLVVGLLAVGCQKPPSAADLGPPVETRPEDPAARERALTEVHRLGGRCEVDEDAPAKPVRVVELSGRPATDATLKVLAGLPNLRRLYLGASNVTDAGLPHLKGLTQLHTLALDGTAVTDAGAEDLKRALPQTTIIR